MGEWRAVHGQPTNSMAALCLAAPISIQAGDEEASSLHGRCVCV